MERMWNLRMRRKGTTQKTYLLPVLSYLAMESPTVIPPTHTRPRLNGPLRQVLCVAPPLIFRLAWKNLSSRTATTTCSAGGYHQAGRADHSRSRRWSRATGPGPIRTSVRCHTLATAPTPSHAASPSPPLGWRGGEMRWSRGAEQASTRWAPPQTLLPTCLATLSA